MGFTRRALPLLASVSLLAGCFGYNPSAKRWAYVGNGVLIAGGGAAIAVDVTAKDEPCMPDAMNNGCSYRSPIHGAMVVGIALVAAGLFGALFNATRDNVKTSR
jgi:hypothetical protein